MPKQTFILKREGTALGFKAAKDRESLLFCTKAKQDCITKPMMLTRARKNGLAWQVGEEGFDDMDPEELDDLIASHAEELTEELDAITKVSEEEEEEEDSDEEEEVPRSN